MNICKKIRHNWLKDNSRCVLLDKKCNSVFVEELNDFQFIDLINHRLKMGLTNNIRIEEELKIRNMIVNKETKRVQYKVLKRNLISKIKK